MNHTPEWESLGFVLGSRPKQVVWQHTSGLQVIANFDEYKETDALLNSHDRLIRENRILQLKADASLANNLCPDHRDKQIGKPCLACEIERLQSKNDRLTDEVKELHESLACCEGMKNALTAEVRRRRETINGITAGWLAIAERPDSTKQYAACLRKCAAALLSLNPEEPK